MHGVSNLRLPRVVRGRRQTTLDILVGVWSRTPSAAPHWMGR